MKNIFNQIRWWIIRNGLFDFSFSIGKLHVYMCLLRPDFTTMNFIVFNINILWGAKWIFTKTKVITNKQLDERSKDVNIRNVEGAKR